VLTTAIAKECAITIIDERGWQRAQPRKVTPRLIMEVKGVAYVLAHCHLDGFEKVFRPDRIQRCGLA
jgi:DNA polymerase III subunit epsilon